MTDGYPFQRASNLEIFPRFWRIHEYKYKHIPWILRLFYHVHQITNLDHIGGKQVGTNAHVPTNLLTILWGSLYKRDSEFHWTNF